PAGHGEGGDRAGGLHDAEQRRLDHVRQGAKLTGGGINARRHYGAGAARGRRARAAICLPCVGSAYALSGSLYEERASNFQPSFCFCHTCMTPILVLVALPSSSVSDTQR